MGYCLTWDNGLVLYSNKADGNGKMDKLFKIMILNIKKILQKEL